MDSEQTTKRVVSSAVVAFPFRKRSLTGSLSFFCQQYSALSALSKDARVSQNMHPNETPPVGIRQDAEEKKARILVTPALLAQLLDLSGDDGELDMDNPDIAAVLPYKFAQSVFCQLDDSPSTGVIIGARLDQTATALRLLYRVQWISTGILSRILELGQEDVLGPSSVALRGMGEFGRTIRRQKELWVAR